jgi:hypothetical protein
VRPLGLRLDAPAKTWWRIDTAHPRDWAWAAYPQPKGRFDPLSGRFRVRYAANRPVVAARERFVAKTLTETDGELWLVELTDFPRSLHLTRQANLDALGLDDRVSTGRIDIAGRRDPDPLLATCGQLADAVYDWWSGRPPPLVYRSRTAPSVGRSIAFTEAASPRVVRARRLAEATALHTHLVLQAGFTVPSGWLSS